MNEASNRAKNFVREFRELKDSFAGVFKDNSFDADLVMANLPLIEKGRYCIKDDIWRLDDAEHRRFLVSFAEVAGRHADESRKDMAKLGHILDNNTASTRMVMHVLTNRQREICDCCRQEEIGIEPMTFFSVFAGYPYREAVRLLVETRMSLREHVSGFCPVCGHWPGMSYLVGSGGKRVMHCICCGAAWLFRRMKCSFCLSAEKGSLGYLNVDGVSEISAYTCDRCRRYVKTRRIKEDDIASLEETAVIDYLVSGAVDAAAMENKYLQESLLGTRFEGPDDEHIELYYGGHTK